MTDMPSPSPNLGAGNRAASSVALAVAAALLLAGTALAQDRATEQRPTQPPPADPSSAAEDPTGPGALPGSELWAEARLITTYSLNEHLNPFDIDVDVEGDTVILAGTVEDQAQRELAVRLARELSGIDNVDDRLEVAPAGDTVAPANPVYRAVEEANTSTRVKLQLLWREPIDGLLVNVMTRGGTVVLTGQVRSEDASQLAERIARRTSGVAEVENRLQVDPEAGLAAEAEGAVESAVSTATDAWITTRVAASLRCDRAVDAERIDVSTEDGVVTLSGRVPSLAQKRLAAEIAGDIQGVREVTNALGVDESG
jgi:osmotically-inducible protein OsmY